ncbi:cytochrome c oxidase assembly protein [Pseudovibrio exalbescens]|uniref:cytochrome c oxidase assembly protein n=1 Tax=Pseudovibrio exalbescens TaxID=197461 RepID=UPI0023670768|nr:cytochrome c oxidase assembly protein [Pseudovibrio exalbescens]MDD7911298.1 cytochrome c oxidase assembly protein [Pseudovibrio exalbescens]
MTQKDVQHQNRSNAKVAFICVGVFFSMVGLSFAAVPLYDLFCRVTGYGGTTQRVDVASETVLDREIIVRFDANTNPNLPWEFEAKTRVVRVKLGQMAEVFYSAENVSSRKTVGTSTFNVSPAEMGGYFNKIDCFCFTEQPLVAGEQVDMPVLFFIDPAMVEDERLDNIREVTLSYTFFPVTPDGEEETAATVLDDAVATEAKL